MELNLRNQVAFVTGGASGIGRATALAFAREGAKVAVADILESAEDTISEIRRNGGEAIYLRCDTSRDDDVRRAIELTTKQFGRLDHAFNNAGVEGAPAPTPDCTVENWNRVIDINLKGVWLCMKYEIPQMLRQGSGSIVNCSSIAGLVGFAHMPAYVASKHGVVGLTRTAALEYARSRIRVNAVCPGVIQTPMIDRFTHGDPSAHRQLTEGEPMHRVGRPEEIAAAVLWLCSESSSFVTGQALAVDGGWVAQ